MLAGSLSDGCSLSVTVTVKVPLALLPWMSVTLTSTVWLPTAKRCGLRSEERRVGKELLATPQLSVGVAAKVTLALQAPVSLLTAMLAGTLTTGFSLSVTFTVKLPLALLPWMSDRKSVV